MAFFNSHKKWIGLVTALSFLFLVGISALPLNAMPGPADDQHPGAIEKIASSGKAAVKKNPLIPILVGVAAIGIVTAVLVLVVFKTKYDIVGYWTGTMSSTSGDSWIFKMTFSGDKKAGTLIYEEELPGTLSGTYSVDGKNVSFTIVTGGAPMVSTGQFDTKDTMSGTWVQGTANNGTWDFTRAASSASSALQPKTGN